MRATVIVYILIGVIFLLPWLTYNIKIYLNMRKEKKRPSIGRILSTVVVTILILAAVYGHYRFTSGYQAPLVAERAGQLFSQRVEGKLDLPEYEDKMQKQGLAAPGLAAVSGEKLELSGFQWKHYDLYISERTYPTEDGGIIMYLMHSDGQATLYSYVKLRQAGYKWQVAVHDILTQQEFEKLNNESKIKFYAVKP